MRDKHLRLDQQRLSKVKKVLRARTETEALHAAMDRVLADADIDRALRQVKGKVNVEPVFEPK
ncbi:MAG: hypothetical protein HY660_01150 [Armatimonadetes bacterium]|nr:hypothetical protein [Armatimonadota bacterium]